MRTRLVRHAVARVGCAIRTVLVAVSDPFVSATPEAVRHVQILGRAHS